MDLSTDAPTIGRVRDLPGGSIRPGTFLRPSAVALDGTAGGAFHVAAASMIGAAHLHSGVPRQDAYAFMVGNSGRLYLAIADGLGSRPASQLGSHLFTESALIVAAEFEAGADNGVPQPDDIILRASSRMKSLATDIYHLDPAKVGCVGAVAIFSDDGGVIARLGDISAFRLAGGEFTELFQGVANPINIVNACMPGGGQSDIESVEVNSSGVVVLATDGLATDIRNSPTLREWLANRWRTPQMPFAIGDSLRYRRQGSHDDRTAVVAWWARAEMAESPY